MDNITLSKNQLQAVLELVSQIGSNRSQNVSVSSVTPTWERGSLNHYGNDFLPSHGLEGENNGNHIDLGKNLNCINISPSKFADSHLYSKSTESIQSNKEMLFWSIEDGNGNTPGNNFTQNQKQHQFLLESNNLTPALEYSYPYFSHNSQACPLIKSQSLGAIECPSVISSPSTKENRSVKTYDHQLVPALSSSSLAPPRTAPSPSHSLISLGSSQGTSQVNFRRYARSVSSSFASIVGIGESVDWEEKRRKMLQYRAELAAQKEEKEKREREEKQKARAEEEVAERRMMTVQNRLRQEYEMERRLIEEKRETIERRRLAVVAAMEQSKNRNRFMKGEKSSANCFDDFPIGNDGHLVSVATQTDIYTNPSMNDHNEHQSSSHYYWESNNALSKRSQCSSSAQTDISLLFDLIRSLGFSTMTLRSSSDNENDSDDDLPRGDLNRLRCQYRLKTPINRLSKTPRPRLGRNHLKFDLNDSLFKSTVVEPDQPKTGALKSKSASHTNLTRIGKSRSEINQEESSNQLKKASSSHSLASLGGKANRTKGIFIKRKSTPNLPIINSNQGLNNRDYLIASARRKAPRQTLEGIL